MNPDIAVGQRLPDLALTDHRRRVVRLSDLAAPTTYDQMLGFTDGYPVIVVFYRGFF